MTPDKSRRHSSSTRRHREHARPAEMPLDAAACRAIVSFLLELARCGYSLHNIDRVIHVALRAIPRATGAKEIGTHSDVDDNAHVAALWQSKRLYRLKGKPIPLALRGPEPSIEALVRETNPNLDLMETVRQLVKARVMRKVGRRYVLRSEMLSTRGSAQQAAHHLRALNDMLNNHQHNAAPKRLWPSWFDWTVDSPNYPVSQLDPYVRYSSRLATAFLKDLQSYVVRKELGRKPNEPTMRVAMTLFEHREGSKEIYRPVEDLLRRVRAEVQRRSRLPRAKRATRL